MRMIRLILAAAVATCGLLASAPMPAGAADWRSIMPERCGRTDPSAGPGAKPITLHRPITQWEMARAIQALTTGSSPLAQPDAAREVALNAANMVRSGQEAVGVESSLRRLWLSGDLRAAFEYGQLADRWSDASWRPDALEAYRGAAVDGDVPAMLALGRRLSRDGAAGAERGAQLAAHARALLAAAIAAGACDKAVTLAKTFLDPVEGAPDSAQAAALLSAAADRGVVGATEGLARLYLTGEGQPYSPAIALDLLATAYAAGSETAGLALAEQLLRGPLDLRDPPRAEAILAGLERSGWTDPNLLLLMAKHAAGQFGGPFDPKAAQRLLERAATMPNGGGRAAAAILDGWTGEMRVGAARAALAATADLKPDALLRLVELDLLADGPKLSTVDLLRSAARAGSVASARRLRALAIAGTTAETDAPLAMALLRDAAAHGSEDAAAFIADALAYEALVGTGDVAADREALRKAAERGGIVAPIRLGRALDWDLIAAKAVGTAAGLRARAEAGAATSPNRMQRLGRELALASLEPKAALHWFERCVLAGLEGCHTDLAKLRMKGGSGADASTLSLLARAAAAGDVEALFLLSQLPGGRPEDMIQAASRGDFRASLAAASEGPPPGLDAALRRHERVRRHAESDIDKLAQMGAAYRRGEGVPRIVAAADDMLSRAAALGSASAMRELARLKLAHPEAPAPDQARAWLAKAAALGDVAAMELLAAGLVDGSLGAADRPLSDRYALLAAYHGSRAGIRQMLAASTGPGVSLATDERLRLALTNDGEWGPLVDLASRLLDQGDEALTKRAAGWAADAANAGDPHALYLMGRLAEDGNLPEADAATAAAFYRRSVEGGYLPAVLAEIRLGSPSRSARPSNPDSKLRGDGG